MVELDDFDPENATRILLPGLQHVHPDQAKVILDRVLYWTGGHPYLTQRMCAEAATASDASWSDERVDGLVAARFFHKGLIRNDPNLQSIDNYICGSRLRQELIAVYHSILSGKTVNEFSSPFCAP